MTIAETEKFYAQDQKEYEVLKNKELLSWLNLLIENGYNCPIALENLQELIDNITYWYEVKYPEREMEYCEGVRYYDFEKMDCLSKYMDIKQLMYRLSSVQLDLIKCGYLATGGFVQDVYNENGEIIGQESYLSMSIKRKKVKQDLFLEEYSKFLIYANAYTGKILIDYNLKDYVDGREITLDELLMLFKEKYSDELDFGELEHCVYNHNCDMELRRRVLQLVALKLVYSNRTIPERGYERAKRFINEFNKKLGLDLNSEEIDEVISRDYSGSRECCCTVDNVSSQESVSLENMKRLGKVKSLKVNWFKSLVKKAR